MWYTPSLADYYLLPALDTRKALENLRTIFAQRAEVALEMHWHNKFPIK